MRQRKQRKPRSPLAKQIHARGLTQKTFAERMRVAPSTVSNWLTGKFIPEPERVPHIARELSVDPNHVEEWLDAVLVKQQM